MRIAITGPSGYDGMLGDLVTACARTTKVRAFVQSIQATAKMSGSSNGSERQNTPPLAET